MIRKKLLLLFALLPACALCGQKQQDLTAYVNTMQGSHNTPEFSHGRCTPLVALPQGVNSWSPVGFSYVGRSAAGVGGCGIVLRPLTEVPSPETATATVDTASIVGRPHYFRMRTSDGILSEMSPTERCAVFRFTYPRRSEALLALSGEEMDGVEADAAARCVTGYVIRRSNVSQAADKTWFLLRFDRDFTVDEDRKGGTLLLRFGRGGTVGVQAAVSKIDARQARVTFGRELEGKRFGEVCEAARERWNGMLGRIEVEGGTPEQRRTFYSCLFRTMLRPAQDYETDAEGRERFAYDGEVYEGRYHVNPILWDAYRSLFALHNIINRAEEERYVQSLMRTQELTGWWPSGHVMIGNHAISVLADAWAKGIRTFDPEEALGRYYREITRSAVDTLNNGDYNREHVRGYGRLGFEDYFAMGYIPYPQGTDRVMETTSKTIEYNYDDFCAWRLARMTGNDFYERIFARHIYNYRNVFDPADGFFKGRDREGRFDEDFNPYEWGGPFVEGNGWQWRFSVQQDARGMIGLMGGEEAFRRNLDELFAVRADSVLHGGYGYRIHEINEAVAGNQGQYAQGNEPCFHVIHLYNHAGQPWKAQRLLRESLTRLFNSGPEGFPGDEDGGAMSSWYVFNAMGFYTVTPGVGQYVLGSPLFDRVTIRLENGRKFVITADGNAPDRPYIRSATLNGAPWTKNWFDHETLMAGGELRLEMSGCPNTERGTAPEDRPYSMSDPE